MLSISHRNDLPSLLPENAMGVELGVARGDYTEMLAVSGKFEFLLGIDAWAGDRGHGAEEMEAAINRLKKWQPTVSMLQATFEGAVSSFANGSLDFIYIDGYAHTGQEGGETLEQWWPKLKPGGIFAGHDFCPCWMPTLISVQNFCASKSMEFSVTGEACETSTITHPSWWLKKKLGEK